MLETPIIVVLITAAIVAVLWLVYRRLTGVGAQDRGQAADKAVHCHEWARKSPRSRLPHR
jgi:hypothetical protein